MEQDQAAIDRIDELIGIIQRNDALKEQYSLHVLELADDVAEMEPNEFEPEILLALFAHLQEMFSKLADLAIMSNSGDRRFHDKMLASLKAQRRAYAE